MNKLQRFNLYYSQFLSAIANGSDLLLSLVRTVLVTFGVPIALVFIMFVEQDRIYHGILIFEKNNDFLVRLAACVLVILNGVLEFLIVYEYDKKGFSEPPHMRWSGRIMMRSMIYKIGFSEPKEMPPAHKYRMTLSIVTFTILALALMGSMKGVIGEYDGLAWHQALSKVLLDSSLSNFMTWVGGVLFAYTLVIAAQTLSNYLAVHTTTVINAIKQSADEIKTAIEQEKIEAQRVEDIITSEPIQLDPRIHYANGVYMATCSECAGFKDREYDSYDAALRGLTSHKPYCRVVISSNGHVTEKVGEQIFHRPK